MTLRELSWAARGRERAEWARTAISNATLINLWSKRKVDPLKLMPEHLRDGMDTSSVRKTSFKRLLKFLPVGRKR